MALLQNQFGMSNTVGTRVSGGSLTVEFYSATSTDTIVPGEAVALSSTVNGQVTKVAKGSALTSKYMGVVLTNALKEVWGVGEKMEIAVLGTVVYMTASAAVTAGDMLQYAYATGKVATNASVGTNTTIGFALENAAADGDIIRVYVTGYMK